MSLLLVIPFVLGEPVENYNDVQYVKMGLSVYSDLSLIYSPDYSMDFIKSDLSFFPQDNEMQEVISLDTYSTPYSEINQGSESLIYMWSGNPGEHLRYGYDAVITVDNEIYRISEKKHFPLLKLDSTVLTYTQPTEYIDINSKIERKAEEIVGADDDLYSAVFKIADWTNKNIDYNLSTLTAEVVQPSSWVLETRNGVCDEMTNLFISLLRSVGIPARFVSGMVYSNVDNQWGPHGWAEVYFPDIGWVPFDVTFGEYGWLDPSHIKLKSNLDSGNPTAKYSWKANGVDLNVGGLEIETTELSVGPKELDALEITVEPLFSNAQFGSYIPVEVRIKNIKDSYVVPKIVVSKAPGLTEDNVKNVLLKPREEKSIYWIVELPEVDPNYIYTTTFEVKGMYGETAAATIKYGDDFELYSEEYAQTYVQAQEERGEKKLLISVNAKCKSDRIQYYSGEVATITCELSGGSDVDLNYCFMQDCQNLNLNGGTILTNQFEVSESIRLPIIIESSDKIRYEYVNLDVIPIPEILISNPKPTSVNYKDDVEVSFDVSSNTNVKNLKILFEFGELNYEAFKKGESKTITMTTQGSQLMDDVKFEISYTDEMGANYREQKAVHVIVKNVPWYGGMINWIRRLF